MYTASKDRYTTMEYSHCGNSGLMLPKVSLGLWHNFGDTANFENMKQLCFTAFDNGITQFDLANNYGPEPGSAEKNFGKILKEDLGIYRDELIITTKAGYEMCDAPFGYPFLQFLYRVIFCIYGSFYIKSECIGYSHKSQMTS